MMKKMSIFILVIFSYNTAILAKDLGKLGQTFDIKEEPFISMIKRKLSNVNIKKAQQKMQNIAKERVENPASIINISKAKKSRAFYFDPTYILDRDAVLPDGRILYPAGTTVNPLDHIEFNRRMFFIDGRDIEQVEWLKFQLANSANTVNNIAKLMIEDRIILVGGSVLELSKELGTEGQQEVYFDQNGELTGRFGIKFVPAIAMQDGKKIRINEININK